MNEPVLAKIHAIASLLQMSAALRVLSCIILLCAGHSVRADEKVTLTPLNNSMNATVLSGYLGSFFGWSPARSQNFFNPSMVIPITLPGGRIIGYRAIIWDHAYQPYFLQLWSRH